MSKLILFGEPSLRRALRGYLVHYHADMIGNNVKDLRATGKNVHDRYYLSI